MSTALADVTTEADIDGSFDGASVNDSVKFDERRPVQLTLKVGYVVTVIAAVIAVLFVTGSAANLIADYVARSPEDKLARLMARFDLTAESSIPNWYSTCALMSAATLLFLIARSKYVAGSRWFIHWAVLGALFVGLSIDEASRFHEMVNTMMSWFVNGHNLLYYPWVIPAIIFSGIVGLSYLPFLLCIERRTALLFVLAGAIYVGGAVGMDAVGGDLAEHFGKQSLYPHFSEYTEELMEDSGQLIFIYALLRYVRRNIGTVQVSVQ